MQSDAQIDWVHLPAGSQPISLWDCLHDGELCSALSNLLERSITLEFAVGYLFESDSPTFQFRFHEVKSARVTRWSACPGLMEVPPDASLPEQQRLSAESASKGREESESWSSFEASLRSDDLHFDRPEISNAELAIGDTGVALKLELVQGRFYHASGTYYDLVISAKLLSTSYCDGQPLSLQELRALGEAYWTRFAEQKVKGSN